MSVIRDVESSGELFGDVVLLGSFELSWWLDESVEYLEIIKVIQKHDL